MNNYPYPVLSADGSAYKENYSFELKYLDSAINENYVLITFSLSLNSKILTDLIFNGGAKAVIRIKSGILVESFDIKNLDTSFTIKIDINQIQPNDSIFVIAYVILSKQYDYVWNEELLDIFDRSMIISLRKNDILAESNKEVLNYNLRSNDFLKFVPSENQNGKGIKISLSDPNYISIIIGTDLNAAYTKQKANKNLNRLFAANIIFEAFIYTISEIVINSDDYCDYEWYKLLDQLFLSTGESIDDFKSRVSIDNFDVSQIYEKSQELINNEIEKSLIDISNKEGD